MAQKGLQGIGAEVGVYGDGIRAVALEGLDRIALGGAADVAALGIENHRHRRVGAVHVFDGALELVLGLVGGVVRDLRLVGTHEVVRGVDDRLVELEDRRGLGGDVPREALDLRIKTDAHERIVRGPGLLQGRHEALHAAPARQLRFFRCTSRICTAAGVTPGTRPAAPRVAGRTA